MKEQKKLGIAVSYLNLFLNMFINVFFTPFLISSLGDAEYGVYRIINSFAGQLSIMTFGMAALVTRNIVFFDAKEQKKEKENFLAMALIISVIMSVAVLVIGYFMFQGVDRIFENSFSMQEISVAKQLIILFVANVSVLVLTDCFSGMLTGHERFLEFNLIKTLKLGLRILTLVILLNCGFGSVAIVATDLVLSITVLIFDVLYGIFVLKERIHFYYFDKVLFKSSMLFSLAIFLQAIISQINQNVDGMILGIMTDPKTVAVYSIALTVYTTYNCIPTVITSVFSPYVTRMIAKEASSEQLSKFVSDIGRYQLIVCGAIISGFILFGEEFIGVWVGNTYLPAYEITLILIIPVTIPLIQNGCNVILDAKLKRMGRSIILGVMALLNVLISVVLIRKMGYIGAAYGTALSLLIGNVIIMNIYLSASIGLKITKIFKDIFHKILPCIVISSIICIPIRWFEAIDNSWISLCMKLVIFLIIYSIIIYKFGMNKEEKNTVKNILRKIKIKGAC